MKNRFYRVAAVSVIAVLGAVGLTACGETDELQGKYDALQGQYEELQGNYDTVRVEYEGLQEQYGELETEHESLQSQYGEMETRYGTAAGELTMHNAILDYYKTLESDTLNFDTADLPEGIAAVVDEVIAGLRQVKAGTMTTTALAELHISIAAKVSALYTVQDSSISAVGTGINISNSNYQNDSSGDYVYLRLEEGINDDVYAIYYRHNEDKEAFIGIENSSSNIGRMQLVLIEKRGVNAGQIGSDAILYKNNGWTVYSSVSGSYYMKNDVLMYILTNNNSFVFSDGTLKIEIPEGIEGIRFTVGDYWVELFFAKDYEGKLAYRVNGGEDIIVGTVEQLQDNMSIVTNKILNAMFFGADGVKGLFFESYSEAEATVKDIPAGLDAIANAIAGE